LHNFFLIHSIIVTFQVKVFSHLGFYNMRESSLWLLLVNTEVLEHFVSDTKRSFVSERKKPPKITELECDSFLKGDFLAYCPSML